MASRHDEEMNGSDEAKEGSKNEKELPRGFRRLVKSFAPIWFTWCMNSGILGILTHQLPYQFRGLKVISTIFYLFDLVFFVIFSSIFILRLVIFRRQAYNAITSSPTDLMFIACWPIAWMTLTTLTPLICSNASWGGYGFSLLGYVMWWIAVVWCLAVLLWAFAVMIEQHQAGTERIPMGVILPAVSVSTAAVEGAFLVSLSYGITARLAVPVIVVGYMLVGMGTLLGLLLSAHLLYEHLSRGWPPVAQTTTVFLFVGPMGQGASALLQLGRASTMFFGSYNKGTFLTAEAARAIAAVSTMIALMLLGLGFIWISFSVFAMLRQAFRRKLRWTHSWNSIIFPTGTVVTSLSVFSQELDSPAFRVVETIMLIALVIVFIVNLTFVTANLWEEAACISIDKRIHRSPQCKRQ